MAAQVECHARARSRCPTPAVARCDAVQEQPVSSAWPLPRPLGLIKRCCQPHRPCHRNAQPVMRGARRQPFGPERTHQAVDVPQITHPPRKVAIGDQMRSGMDDHVRRAQHPQAIVERNRIGDQCVRIRGDPRGQRQDSVVDINHPITHSVDQRRQLVHPAAIIGVVIGIGFHPFPARSEQHLLHGIKRCARHQNVEVADRTPHPCLKARRDIGRPFEQHHRHPQRRKRAARHFGFPKRGGAPLFSRRARITQQPRDGGRHRQPGQPVSECADHLLGAGNRDQAGPAVRIERPDGGRIAQGSRQRTAIAHRAAHNASTAVSAASVSG